MTLSSRCSSLKYAMNILGSRNFTLSRMIENSLGRPITASSKLNHLLPDTSTDDTIPNYIDEEKCTGILSTTEHYRKNPLSNPAFQSFDKSLPSLNLQTSSSTNYSERYQLDRGDVQLPHVLHPVSPDMKIARILPVIQPENPKLLKVALLGPANAGKSTLVNKFLGQKVSITSSKSQTTRGQVFGIWTEESLQTQIVFYDTPGLAPPQIKVNKQIAVAPWQAVEDVDMVLFLWDASNQEHSLPSIRHYLNFLKEKNLDLFLLISKSDLLRTTKSRAKSDNLRQMLLTEFPNIQRSFLISSVSNNGVEPVRRLLVESAISRPWLYAKEQKTLYSDVELVEETIREQIYRRLNQEIPYSVRQEIISWDKRDPNWYKIHVVLYVEDNSVRKIVIGLQGEVVNYIKERAEESLSQSFGHKISIFLFVKLAPAKFL